MACLEKENLTFSFNIAIINGCTEPKFWSMPKTKTKKEEENLSNKAKNTAETLQKKAGDVFDDLKKQFEPKKVDAFQKKWLSVPKNRKKYKQISDAPEVALNEMKDMTNDLIEFMQGEEGHHSKLLKKAKEGLTNFLKNPAGYFEKEKEDDKQTF